MQSPARSAAIRRMPRQTTSSAGPRVGLFFLAGFLVFVIGYGQFGSSDHETVGNQPAAEVHPVAGKPVHLVFDPPYPLNDLQNDNMHMVVDIINDPSSWGVTDKAPIKELTGDILQMYLSALYRENHFYHYNDDGDVQLSPTKCCAGIGQVYTLTSVCEGWELKDIRRNAWCSARIFANYYLDLKDKAGPRTNELTVAMYQNAISVDESGNAILENGLPSITGDPSDPDSLRSLVDKVFKDPDTGKPMFRFVTD